MTPQMVLVTSVALAFIVGYVTGFASCFYGVKIKQKPEPYDGGLAGTYVIQNQDGVDISMTRSNNPATSWSLFMKARPGKTLLKEWKAMGFRAKKIA